MSCIRAGTGTQAPQQRVRGRRRRAWVGVAVLGVVLVPGCADRTDPIDQAKADAPAPAMDLTPTARMIGDVLPGTDMTAFAEAADAFGDAEGIEDGLGPIFNDRACGACHSTPVMGGSGAQIERRFGRLTNGVFFGYDRAPDNQGGTLRQLFTNGAYLYGSQACNMPLEVEPADANVNNVGRRTTPLFGLGLVDALPDLLFDLIAAAQPASIRGAVQRVNVVLPDPRDPAQSIGAKRVARFGWKGRVPSLMQFAADAYVNEMGITTQSCFHGQTITAFANENQPNGAPDDPVCNAGDLAPVQPAHADVPTFTDDAVGPCTGGLTEVQEDLVLFTKFMESLAPPPRDLSQPGAILLGAPLFAKIGCAGCHLQAVYFTPAHPFNGVPGNYPFQPFSDFLAHDMGSLGDHIGDTGNTEAQTRLIRTQPLWGARFNTQYLHDGRAPDLRSAILAHDGQARPARVAFEKLGPTAQNVLIKYILSL